MPDKSKRVAARQAKLSKRKGHSRGPTAVEQMQRRNTTETTETEVQATTAQTEHQVEAPVKVRIASGSRTRQETFSPVWQTKAYLKREMLQIGIVSSLIFVTLLSLTFIIK